MRKKKKFRIVSTIICVYLILALGLDFAYTEFTRMRSSGDPVKLSKMIDEIKEILALDQSSIHDVTNLCKKYIDNNDVDVVTKAFSDQGFEIRTVEKQDDLDGIAFIRKLYPYRYGDIFYYKIRITVFIENQKVKVKTAQLFYNAS